MLSPLARSTVRTSAVLGLRLCVQAGTLLLIARMLGPDQFGSYAGLTALAVLLGSFASFGTHLVLLAEVSKEPQQRHRVLAYAVPTTMLCGGSLFAFFLLLAQHWWGGGAIPLWAIACIGITETLLLPLYTLPAMEELALEKTVKSQLWMLLPLALRTLSAGAVLGLASAQPMPIFMLLYTASAVVALLAMWLYKPGAWSMPRHWRWPQYRQLKHSAGYATLALTSLGPSELDKILASKLMAAGIAGNYAAASRLIGAATLPVIALLLSVMPRLFRSAKMPKQSQYLHMAILAITFFYGCMLGGLLWLVAPWIQGLFGPTYVDLVPMVRCLCWVVPGLSVRIAAGSVLMAQEQTWRRASVELIGVTVLISTACVLFPHYGLIGMAVALSISEWGMAFLGIILIFKLNNKAAQWE